MGVVQLEPKPGFRFAQARRLLSYVLGKDLSQTAMSVLAGVSGNAWNEWERDLSYPRAGNMEKVIALFASNGMPYITQKWIDYGIQDAAFPRVVTAPFEVAPHFPARVAEPVPTAAVATVRSYEEQAAAAKKKATPKRRARGGE